MINIRITAINRKLIHISVHGHADTYIHTYLKFFEELRIKESYYSKWKFLSGFYGIKQLIYRFLWKMCLDEAKNKSRNSLNNWNGFNVDINA